MDALRTRVTLAIVAVFLALLVMDALDDLLWGNRWSGCPKELYAVIGALVAGLYAAQAFRVGSNGNGKSKEGG